MKMREPTTLWREGQPRLHKVRTAITEIKAMKLGRNKSHYRERASASDKFAADRDLVIAVYKRRRRSWERTEKFRGFRQRDAKFRSKERDRGFG